ncbi:hypothetical protein ACFXJ8_06960 [Nonomuraea sp. NPDC059194]|uniref:hypothetical protein n=1 Tax=Nonomuraea sp. NPDC059194 TaxID=3346764 RepID=UPI0036AFD90F
MNYSINFVAAAQCPDTWLPAEAWQALVDELLIIGADPDHRGVQHPEDARFREQAFGAAGLASYVIDDAVKIVHIYSIVWAG